MEINRTEKFIVLAPAEGKVLTNGEAKSDEVYLPIDGDVSVWSEIDKPIEDEEIDNEVVINELKEAING